MYSYFGICPDGKESLILFEAVKRGMIPTVSDRLSEEERKEIVSGAIYIWDERKSPMRRWTDGRTWSNSRVVGDFLEYRESIPDLASKSGKYDIKPYGLRKRTICSPALDNSPGSSLRLIAYFKSSDVKAGVLKLPSKDPQFADIVREINDNSIESSHSQLMNSVKKRKRFKSTPNLKQQTKSYEAGSTLPLTSKHIQKDDNGATTWHHTSQIMELQPPSIMDKSPSLGQKPNLHCGVTGLQFGSASAPVSPGPISPIRGSLNNKVAQLPSPVWCPQNMHSEDRRALDLLDSHDIVTKDISHHNL